MASKQCTGCERKVGKNVNYCPKCGEPTVFIKATDDATSMIPEFRVLDKSEIESLSDAAVEVADPGDSKEEDIPEGLVETPHPEASTDSVASKREELAGSVTYRLKTLNGPKAGTVFSMNTIDIALVGSGADADVQLPGDLISRKHALLKVQGGRLVIVDEHSTNGTFVRVDSATVLQPGSVVLIGRTLLEVQTDE